MMILFKRKAVCGLDSRLHVAVYGNSVAVQHAVAEVMDPYAV